MIWRPKKTSSQGTNNHTSAILSKQHNSQILVKNNQYMIKVYNLHIAIVDLTWSIFKEKTSFIEHMRVMFCNSFSFYEVT